MAVAHLQRILVATDLSPRAERALRRAVQLAAQHRAQLSILHVLEDRRLEEGMVPLRGHPPEQVAEAALRQARQGLEQLLAGLAAPLGVSYEIHAIPGRPTADIVAHAQAFAADVVVLGAHGRYFARDLVVSTTAERVVRKGRQPILVVKREAGEPYDRALVAVDFSPASRRALEETARLVPNATLHVVHAYDTWYEDRMQTAGVPDADIDRYHQDNVQRLEEAMRRFLDSAQTGTAKLVPEVKPGYPATVIWTSTQQLGVPLLCLGSHGRNKLQELLLGSVTTRAMHEASCDVLVVRESGS